MVFVSYAREDQQAALKLVHELESTGIHCILDPELIEGDPFWRETIARCFGECQLMVGLVSREAWGSPWVEQEQRAFPGPKLWIALDPLLSLQELGMASDRLITPSRASVAIHNAVCGRAMPSRRRSPAPQGSPGEQREQRMREEGAKLKSFRTRLCRLPRPRLEMLGQIARIGDNFLELRRIGQRAAADVYVGTLPVTNSQYRTFLDATDYRPPPTWERAEFRADDAPVTGINWFEACAFASWVGGSLPGERDWQQAARGQDPRRTYATATGEINSDLASFGRPFGSSEPESAGAYPPNAEGYYGMCGNVWDWCSTPWGTHRAIRGGGCMDAARFCAISARYRNSPIDRDCCVGFRVKIKM
jgi:hypothetical protein